MALEKQLKWEGKASAELKGPKAEQIWPLLEDFFGLHKWFPTLTTCLGVEGTPGVAGCVRFCAGVKTPVDPKSDQNQDQEKVNWTKQKLLSIDPEKMTYSYSIIDGNIGFTRTFRLFKWCRRTPGVRLCGSMKLNQWRDGGWRIWTCSLALACKSWLAEWKPLFNSKLNKWKHKSDLVERMSSDLYNPAIKPATKSSKVDKLSDL